MTAALIALWFALFFSPQGIPYLSNGMAHAQGSGTPTLDQKSFNYCSAQCAGSPPAQSVTLNATAGTVVVIIVTWCADVSCGPAVPVTGDIASVSDGVDTITASQFCTGPPGRMFANKLYYIQSATGGSQTLTVTYNTGKGFYASVKWSSWTGLASSSVLDQTGCADGSSTSPSIATSGNLSQSDELIIGAVENPSCTLSAGSGFTLLNSTGGNGNEADDYKVGGTSGATTSALFTQCNTGWAGLVATFKHL